MSKFLKLYYFNYDSMKKKPIQENYFSCQTKGDKCNSIVDLGRSKRVSGLIKSMIGFNAVSTGFFC